MAQLSRITVHACGRLHESDCKVNARKNQPFGTQTYFSIFNGTCPTNISIFFLKTECFKMVFGLQPDYQCFLLEVVGLSYLFYFVTGFDFILMLSYTRFTLRILTHPHPTCLRNPIMQFIQQLFNNTSQAPPNCFRAISFRFGTMKLFICPIIQKL